MVAVAVAVVVAVAVEVVIGSSGVIATMSGFAMSRINNGDVRLHASIDVERDVGDADGPATMVGANVVRNRLVGQDIGVYIEPTSQRCR